MHMFKNAVAASLLLGALSCFSTTAAVSNESTCDASLKGHMAVLTEDGYSYAGEVTINGCDDLVITFQDGHSINVADAFEHQQGFDFFKMNITFIAQNFFPPMPEEYRVDDYAFRMVPDLSTITATHSDLALNYQMGAADTVFFKLQEAGSISFIQVTEVTGEWEIDLS